MKASAVALPLVLFLLGCSVASATRQTPAADAEAMIRHLDEEERVAVLQRDTMALHRLWSEHLMVNAPSNQVAANRSVVLGILRQGMINYSRFERRIERLLIEGDIAFVMGSETIQPAGGSPQAGQTVERRFTHVWRNEQGVWRLVARHANNLPRP